MAEPDPPIAPAARPAPAAALWLPGVVLGAAAIALWLIYDTPAGDVALFCAFELAFVLVPGCLAYLALAGAERSLLRVLVTGAALGYSLQILFYIASAASGADPLFWAYPVLVGGAALAALGRKGVPAIPRPSIGTWELAAATGVAAAALLLLAINLFEQTVLPGESPANSYLPDIVWGVAIAGEAKHVWPLDIPALAGKALRYHYFVNLDQAAISKTTGIEQAVVNFRLYAIPLLLLVVGGLLEAGRAVGRRAWAGVAGAALVVLVGDFDPLPLPPSAFFEHLYTSGSFLFGMALFLPLLCELIDRLRPGAGEGRGAGPWIVIAILLLACSGSKATILPAVASGLLAGLAWAAWRHREQLRPLATALALTVGAFAVSYLALYRREAGGRESQSEALLFGVAKRTDELADFTDGLPDAGPVPLVANALGTLAGTVEALAPILIGLLLVAFIPRLRSSTEVVICLGMLAVGAVAWSLYVHPGTSQYYLLWYPYAAGGAVAGAAIAWFATGPELDRGRIAAVVAPACAALLAVAAITPHPYINPRPKSEFADERLRVTTTEGLVEALSWVRDNSPGDSVIAVNNGYSAPAVARNCSYTALSERRAMLECEWGTQPYVTFPPLKALRSGKAEHPKPRRWRLNERIFRRGSPEAIRLAHDLYGVDYLVVDRRFTGGPEAIAALDRAATRVFEAPGAIVYSVGTQ